MEGSPVPFLIKAMGQWMAKKSLKTITLEDFPFCNLLVSLSSHLCAEENLGLRYDLEELWFISHLLRVKILFSFYRFSNYGFYFCNKGFLNALSINAEPLKISSLVNCDKYILSKRDEI